MKLSGARLLLFAGALGLAIAAQASAQVPPQSPSPSPAAGTVTGPNVGQARGFVRLLEGLNLTPAQHQRLQTLVTRFQQNHPAGSALDRNAVRELRRQVVQILTPAQVAQLRAKIRQLHAQRAQQQQPQPDASPPPASH